jgi:hypothetical protein
MNYKLDNLRGEIVENLEFALEQFKEIVEDMELASYRRCIYWLRYCAMVF